MSKRLSSPYRSGLSRDWLKINNPGSLATRDKAGSKDADPCTEAVTHWRQISRR